MLRDASSLSASNAMFVAPGRVTAPPFSAPHHQPIAIEIVSVVSPRRVALGAEVRYDHVGDVESGVHRLVRAAAVAACVATDEV